jgi:hypothetical protein
MLMNAACDAVCVMTPLLRALSFIGACFVIASAFMLLRSMAVDGPAGERPIVEYKDYVSILLTALAVMIAVATIIAAFGGFWGFEVLRKELVKTAAETSTKVAEAKIAEVVPGLVEKALKFDREVPAAEADQIAEEYGKEE